MRYVKVLILALFFFLCLVFLFQNQNVLSQKLTLELNLLAIPKMTSIELPFYFIILVSFLAGCVMALLLLLWDRMRLSAHILQQTWRISNLENENHKLVEDMGKLANADEDDRPSMFARIKAQYLKAREDRKAKKGHRAAAKATQEEIDHVKCIKMGTRVTSIYEHDVRLLRQECPDISLITCHDETLCVSWFPGMDGALIGFAGCVPEIICPAREVFANPDKHTLKEAQDWSDRIYHISQAIYGGGQPSGEAHARLKEALKQRGIFKSELMRKPVPPLNDEEKAWVALGLERSQLPEVDMTQFEDK